MKSQLASTFKHRRHELRPFALLAVLVVLFLLLPVLRSGAEVGTVNVKNVLETLSALGLVTLALGLTMIAGEFDLSVSSTFLLGGMLAVTLGDGSWVVGLVAAVGIGLVVGALQGVAIAKLNINSMSITLGGFIALLGLVFVISNSESINYPNLEVGKRLDQTILGVFSIRIFVALLVFAVIAWVFMRTTVGRDLRAIGSDRKASRVAGVRISWLVIGVFALSGFLATLAGAMQGYSLAYATPDRTVAPLIFATTAALLGGVPLSGGRGNPLGIAAGVLSLALVTESIPILRSAEYVNTLVPAILLLIVVIVDAPDRARAWRGLRRRLERTKDTGATGGPEPVQSSQT
jgi:ribose/xylose/arabinose/galactoside ABC-type transport system permease subunit